MYVCLLFAGRNGSLRSVYHHQPVDSVAPAPNTQPTEGWRQRTSAASQGDTCEACWNSANVIDFNTLYIIFGRVGSKMQDLRRSMFSTVDKLSRQIHFWMGCCGASGPQGTMWASWISALATKITSLDRSKDLEIWLPSCKLHDIKDSRYFMLLEWIHPIWGVPVSKPRRTCQKSNRGCLLLKKAISFSVSTYVNWLEAKALWSITICKYPLVGLGAKQSRQDMHMVV